MSLIISPNGKYIAKTTAQAIKPSANDILFPGVYITISKADETSVHTFKQSSDGPHTDQMIKQFVIIDGVTWFISMLNYATLYFINCDNGLSYTQPEDKYNTWRYLYNISPNGHYIVVCTYTIGGNCDYKKIYNISNLAADGPIIAYIEKVSSVYDLDDESVIMRFTGITETEIKLTYINNIDDIEYDIGIYNIAVK